MASSALGDAVAEAANMDRAITVTEQSGDRCLVDLMLVEKKALQERRPVLVGNLPASCQERPAFKEGERR